MSYLTNAEHNNALYLCHNKESELQAPSVRGFTEKELLSYCAGMYACNEDVSCTFYKPFRAILDRFNLL